MTVITDKKAFEKAIPILATDTARLPRLLESLTPVERRWAQTAGFDGSANTFALIPDAKGNTARAFPGSSNRSRPSSVAGRRPRASTARPTPSP